MFCIDRHKFIMLSKYLDKTISVQSCLSTGYNNYTGCSDKFDL